MTKSKKQSGDVRVLDIGQSNVIALDRLFVSPFNVRKTDINDTSGLEASIAEHGLLESLVAYKVEDADRELNPEIPAEVTHLVAAGQRRLMALNKLAADGRIATPADVAVRLVDRSIAIEVSLAENLERKQMNPADETLAFKALVETGAHNADTIAKRFGLPLTLVKRRLKMAVLAEPILSALREGTINLTSAEAYASTKDQDLQLKIFKEQSRPNTYNAHHAGNILRDISYAGIGPKTMVAEFIGGTKAYQKAGGELAIDEDFLDLFANVNSNPEEVRFTSRAIVDQLFNAKCASVEKKMFKAAQEIFPYADAIEWYDADDSGHLVPPTPDKKSGLIMVEARPNHWDESVRMTEADLKKRAKVASEKHKARVVALVALRRNSETEKVEPYVITNRLIVGKDGWEAAKPKAAKNDKELQAKIENGESIPYHQREQLTDEQKALHAAAVAKREREDRVKGWAKLLYGRSIIGPTEGFGVTEVDIDRGGHLTVHLTSTAPLAPELIETNQYGNSRFVDAALEPFMVEAEIKVVEAEREAEIQQREAEARKKEREEARANAIAAFNDAYNAVLDATVPPAVLILTDADPDNAEFEVVWAKVEADAWTFTDDEGEEEAIADFSVVMDLINDYAEDRTECPVLRTFEDLGGYEAHLAQAGDVDVADAAVLQEAIEQEPPRQPEPVE